MISMTMIGSLEIPRIKADIAAGIPVNAMAKDKVADAAKSNMMVPVMCDVSIRNLGKARSGVVLWMKNAKIMV